MAADDHARAFELDCSAWDVERICVPTATSG
jgi:hypothetical protein